MEIGLGGATRTSSQVYVRSLNPCCSGNRSFLLTRDFGTRDTGHGTRDRIDSVLELFRLASRSLVSRVHLIILVVVEIGLGVFIIV